MHVPLLCDELLLVHLEMFHIFKLFWPLSPQIFFPCGGTHILLPILYRYVQCFTLFIVAFHGMITVVYIHSAYVNSSFAFAFWCLISARIVPTFCFLFLCMHIMLGRLTGPSLFIFIYTIFVLCAYLSF